MRVVEKVTCSEEMAKPLIVGVTTVYVHENITPVTDPDPVTGKVPTGLYICKETQYTKDEYIALISKENSELGDTVNAILTDIIPSLMS